LLYFVHYRDKKVGVFVRSWTAYSNKVFTTYCYRVKPVTDFYEAEDYHQDYVNTIPISLMWKAFRYRDTTSLKNI
jgi:peptide methionine sulfoxide reductase MsrA